jgi:hypothetical protein
MILPEDLFNNFYKVFMKKFLTNESRVIEVGPQQFYLINESYVIEIQD